MRKRMLVCLGCGALGLLAAAPVGDRLDIGLSWAFLACGAGGAVFGYVLSVLLDVFLGDVGELGG